MSYTKKKNKLEKEYNVMEEQLHCIEQFLLTHKLPAVIVEAIEDKEMDIINEQRSLSIHISSEMSDSIATEITDWLEELEDERKTAEADGCTCVKNF